MNPGVLVPPIAAPARRTPDERHPAGQSRRARRRPHRRGDARRRAPARARHRARRSSAAAAPPSPAGLLRTAIELGTDAVVVAGGDGTVHLAIQELAGTGVPLGIIPAGTGNDFATRARTAGARRRRGGRRDRRGQHPARSTSPASPAPTGRPRTSARVLASGFDSQVNDRANAMRWPRGGSRYNIAILIEFLTLTGIPYEVDLELADGTRGARRRRPRDGDRGQRQHVRRRHPDLSRRRPGGRPARRDPRAPRRSPAPAAAAAPRLPRHAHDRAARCRTLPRPLGAARPRRGSPPTPTAIRSARCR